MLPSCRSGIGITSLPLKLTISFLEMIMFFHVTTAGSFYVIQILMAVCLSMWNYIRIIQGWSADKSKDRQELLSAYRFISMVGVLNNVCVSHDILPMWLVGFPSIQLTAAVVCIKYHGIMSPPALAFFRLIYVDQVVLCTAVFTPPSHVYIESRKLLLQWKGEWRTGQRSELRRALRALQPVKVQIGTNFIDHSTPLVIQVWN
jgi:hypothetical protein